MDLYTKAQWAPAQYGDSGNYQDTFTGWEPIAAVVAGSEIICAFFDSATACFFVAKTNPWDGREPWEEESSRIDGQSFYGTTCASDFLAMVGKSIHYKEPDRVDEINEAVSAILKFWKELDG